MDSDIITAKHCGVLMHARHCSKWVTNISPQRTEESKDVEKLEFLCTAGENVKWCSYFRKQCGSSSKCYMLYENDSTPRYMSKRNENMICKGNQSQKATYYDSIYEISRIGHCIDTGSRLVAVGV